MRPLVERSFQSGTGSGMALHFTPTQSFALPLGQVALRSGSASSSATPRCRANANTSAFCESPAVARLAMPRPHPFLFKQIEFAG